MSLCVFCGESYSFLYLISTSTDIPGRSPSTFLVGRAWISNVCKLSLIHIYTGFAVRQWYRNLGESHDTPLADIIGIFSHMHPDDRKSVLDFYEKAKAGTERFFDGDPVSYTHLDVYKRQGLLQ